jgi:hypothetical protein
MDWRTRFELMERAAFTEHGKRHSRGIVGFRFTMAALPFIAVAVLVGAVGYACYRVWGWFTAPERSVPEVKAPAPVHAAIDIPAAGWLLIAIAVAIAVIGVRLIYRPYAPSAPLLRGAVALLFLSLGAVSYWWGLT